MKILFVSIAAPPQNVPESLQVAKYIKGLSESNEVSLVTIKESEGWESPERNLLRYLDKVTKVVALNHYSSRYVRFVLRRLSKRILKRTDEHFMFPLQWRKVVKEITHPEVIYSRATPFSSCLMGYNLKKYYKCPWVMHMSDLWADSPIFNFVGKDLEYHQTQERKCFEFADRISFTSIETIEFYERKYKSLADKFFFSPNVYENQEANTSNEMSFEGKLKFMHAGNFYGPGRNPVNFLKALSKAETFRPDILTKVEVHFVGRLNADIKKAITAQNLNCVTLTENYTFDESVSMQRTSHVLLLFDWKFEKMKSVFFLSKILGYMASRRFILAITGKKSTCYNVIENKYGRCFEHDDIDGLTNFILKIVDNFEAENTFFFQVDEPDPQLSADYNVLKLSDKMLQLVSQ